MAHALGLVKSFLPSMNLSFIGDGVAVGCSEEQFSEYVAEMKPVADKFLSSFFSDTSRDYLAQALGLVKPFLTSVNLSFIGYGVAVGCSEERFSEYVAEMKPIADKIISGLGQRLRLRYLL